MVLFQFNACDLDHPPQEIVEFVERLIGQYKQDDRFCGANERRSEQRHPIAVPIIARPVGEDLQSAGEPFVAVTKDISTRGVALLHHEPIDSKYMAVRLTDRDGRKLTGAIEVLRCRQVGQFFEVGGKFVTKLYDRLERIRSGQPLAAE